MKKKRCEKKKQCRKAGWATTHFPALCHDTMYCIVIGKGTGTQGRAVRPCDTTGEGRQYSQDKPRHGRQLAGACGKARARARLGWWGVSRYNCLYRDRREAWPLRIVSRYEWAYRDRRAAWLLGVSRDRPRPCYTVGQGRDTAPRYDREARNTTEGAATWRAAALDNMASDTAGRALQHNHDTAPGAPRYSRPSTQRAPSHGLGCASCAPNPVLTQDTVLSHCLNHYS